MVTTIFFVSKDYEFFGSSLIFYGLVALRLFSILCCTWLIYKLGKIDDYRKYDKYLFFTGFAAIASIALINLSRPSDYYLFIILDMSIIAVIYTIIPTKLLNQITLGSLFTITDILIFVLTRDQSVHSMFVTIIPGLLLVNSVGITSSWLLQIFRRGQFAAQSEQENARKKLTALALQLQTAQSVSNVGSWTYSPDNDEVTWSDEMYRIYGTVRTEKEPELADHARFMSHGNWDNLRKAIAGTVETGDPYEMEMEIMHPGGSSKIVLSRGQLIHSPATNEAMLIGTSQDVTELKCKEKIIEASLREKETLLKEIQHRVKNNMQVISSLLSMQSQFAFDERDARLFQNSQDRIRSMSLVYDQLYMSHDLAEINLKEYINELSANLINSCSLNADGISSRIEVDNIDVNLDIAIPCGLLVNELITNSLKHAFPDNRTGSIRISMRKDGNMLDLVISDNGVGLPEYLDVSTKPTLGMTLLHTLVEQLGGEVEFRNANGTVFHSRFCLSPAE
jgi:two-component sensor histidine kinase/PAS domain-containing protein